jgi:integrase
MPRSTYGEGSVWYEGSRDLWFGQVYFGPGNRPKVSARKKADMLKKLRALQADKDEGVAPTKGTTGAWLDHWLAQVKRRVELSTWQDYTRWTESYVKPHVESIPLRALEEEDVENMMSELENQGLSPKTVRIARTMLVSALDEALRRDKVRRNVAHLVKPPRQTRTQINDRLDAKGAQAVLKTLWGDRLYALACLALYLGIRPGELFGLKWDQVDLRRKSLRIAAGLKRNSDGWYLKGPKTQAGRRPLPLPSPVVEALRVWKREQRGEGSQGQEGFVFTDANGDPLKGRDVLDWWHKATIAAGVGRRRFYCTRHTAATLMLNNGVPLEVISKILGHSDIAITGNVYAEVQEEMTRDAAKVMEGVLSF